MSLGHVYIVLEPIGSARLMFDDDRYYEFMCFDVPKVVWSPECDHGHDEESRNGRDIKIDILEDYIRTPEWFWGHRINTGVPGSYRNTPGSVWALMGLGGRKEGAAKGGGPPPPQAQSELGGGSAPLSFSPSPSSFL